MKKHGLRNSVWITGYIVPFDVLTLPLVETMTQYRQRIAEEEVTSDLTEYQGRLTDARVAKLWQRSKCRLIY